MDEHLYKLLSKIVEAYDRPYGFESNDFMTGMDELDDILAEGYCKEGNSCNCGGDTKAVRMSCCRWVKP